MRAEIVILGGVRAKRVRRRSPRPIAATGVVGRYGTGRLNVWKLWGSMLICVPLAACAGVTDDSNTYVSPSGKVVHAPPARLRNGNGVG